MGKHKATKAKLLATLPADGAMVELEVRAKGRTRVYVNGRKLRWWHRLLKRAPKERS